MPLDCPRCPEKPLEERRVVPSGGGPAASVHVCGGCLGVWLDGHTLAGLCPTLAHLPEHRGEVALLGREGAGIARCLRCAVAPFEYDVLGVAIDFCLRCHGVWLDGDEYEESLFDGTASAAAEPRGPPRTGRRRARWRGASRGAPTATTRSTRGARSCASSVLRARAATTSTSRGPRSNARRMRCASAACSRTWRGPCSTSWPGSDQIPDGR